jgi:N-acetylglucosaminyl-diphospho-decaprenol L-rhamnosyltransferase
VNLVHPASATTTDRAPIGERFSVVIVNYNGGAMLLDCVTSAILEGVPAAQIVIVDNHSHDDSLHLLEAHLSGTRILRNDCNAGFARAVNQGINQGIAQTSADFVLLLNNDALLEQGALRAFANAFDTLPKLAIAGGQLHYPNGRLQNAFAPLPTLTEELLPLHLIHLFAPAHAQRKTLQTDPITAESVFGACLCVRSAVLPQLGLMDEDYFFFFEEIEWCQRAWQTGFEVYHLPGARAVHRGGHTANLFRGGARVEYQRSKLTFFRKTRSRTSYLVLSVYLIIRTFINALSGLVMCCATLFLNRRLRLKTRTYWFVFLWLILGRPASWGLPEKCQAS